MHVSYHCVENNVAFEAIYYGKAFSKAAPLLGGAALGTSQSAGPAESLCPRLRRGCEAEVVSVRIDMRNAGIHPSVFI